MSDPKPVSYGLSNDPVIRFCAFYSFLYVGSLILGGIGIFEIVLGLMILSTRILVHIPLVQAFIRRLFGFKPPHQAVNHPQSMIYRITTVVIRLIVLGFYVTVSTFLVWMGIKELREGGFLNQNLIYIIFFK